MVLHALYQIKSETKLVGIVVNIDKIAKIMEENYISKIVLGGKRSILYQKVLQI